MNLSEILAFVAMMSPTFVLGGLAIFTVSLYFTWVSPADAAEMYTRVAHAAMACIA